MDMTWYQTGTRQAPDKNKMRLLQTRLGQDWDKTWIKQGQGMDMTWYNQI